MCAPETGGLLGVSVDHVSFPSLLQRQRRSQMERWLPAISWTFSSRSGPLAGMPEVHELPHRLVSEVLDQRAVVEVLHPTLTAEAQIGAIETGEGGR